MNTPDLRGHSRPIAVSILLGSLLLAGRSAARPTGITGLAQSATGCSCHSSTPNENGLATVAITGPQIVAPGAIANYTISVSGGPASTKGGFNLVADSGTLVPGPDCQLLNGQLTHFSPDYRTWHFSWQAPSTGGGGSFYAVAQAVDASGTNRGDSWNWYGGAVNTPFPITLGVTGIGDPLTASFAQLSAGVPNPFVSTLSVGFYLPAAGSIRMDVLDVRGRLVTTLVTGVVTSGNHKATWNGRDDLGKPMAAGLYFVRLRSMGQTLTSHVVKLSR